jgi:hypothetical protein
LQKADRFRGQPRTSLLHGFTRICADLLLALQGQHPNSSVDDLIFSRFFLAFPQGSFIVHSFRTARPQFSVAAQSEMRESSFTASVKVALPVIVQGWFCGD